MSKYHFDKYKYLCDTHTAVASSVYHTYKEKTGDDTKTVIASTASAFKFAESVADAIGVQAETDCFGLLEVLSEQTGVKIPRGLQNLDKKEIRHNRVIKVSEMRDVIEESVK